MQNRIDQIERYLDATKPGWRMFNGYKPCQRECPKGYNFYYTRCPECDCCPSITEAKQG